MDHQPPITGIVLGLTTLLALILTAFAWPASQLAPRELPVAVAAPPEALAGLTAGAAALGEDALAIQPVTSRDAAVALIEEREVYGAIVASPDGTEVLTAPAASPAVAELLAGLAARAPDGAVTITPVVPLPDGDPRGAVFASGTLPMILGGIATAALAWLLVRRPAGVLATVAGVAVAAGLALTGILQGWLGALGGSYWANAGVVALALVAVALPIAGLARLLGTPGIGLGALTVLLLGNPLSGATSAPELLPAGWSQLGQLLPPGAAFQALRSTAFFDGAGLLGPATILAAWAFTGLAILLLPGRRTAPVEERPEPAGVLA